MSLDEIVDKHSGWRMVGVCSPFFYASVTGLKLIDDLDDYTAAQTLKLPVYSIGLTSISMIAPGEKRYTKVFEKFTLSEMKKVNPYCIGETTEWVKNRTP